MYLLDTNVVSELRKIVKGAGAPPVIRWMKTIEPETLYISAMTVMELKIGCLRLKRYDEAQAATLETWLSGYVLHVFRGRILPFDETVALLCAPLHVPDRRSERDAIIAATGRNHDLTVVTRNIRDFRNTGVRLINPWDDPSA